MSKKRLKIFISMDYEGLCSVSSLKNVKKQAFIQELGLIYGILKKDAYWKSIESISICDSHGTGRNIDCRRFWSIDNEKTCFVSASGRKYFMLEGIKGHNLLFFVGYHVRAGNKSGLMGHSYGYNLLREVRLNGIPVGETEINAYLAGEYGVPLALVTGDTALGEEVKNFFPRLCFVPTKNPTGKFRADMYSPRRLREQYRVSLDRIFRDGYRGKIFKLRGNNEMQLDFFKKKAAGKAVKIRGAKRISPHTVWFRSKDYRKIFKFLQTAVKIAKK